MSEIFCGSVEISNESLNELSDNELDVKLFKIKLSTYYHVIPNLIRYLNASELQRAQKYHFEKDSNRFIICRALLKYLLAKHTNLNILEIHIEKDKNKKPYLSSHESISFNVSHAEDYACIAISNTAVGVDVEYLNRNFDFEEILNYTFNDQERNIILKANNKVKRFYKFWTRKEAIVKAIGKGIDDNFSKIPVIDGSHTVSSSLVNDFNTISVFSFDINIDYIGALAITKNNISTNKITFQANPTEDEIVALIQS